MSPGVDGELSLHGAYAQSKWLGEAWLAATNKAGVSFRYGHLLGEPDERELLALVILGLKELGVYPRTSRSSHLYFDVTPTEWAAEQTVCLLKEAVTGVRQTRQLRRGWEASFSDLLDVLREHIELKAVEVCDFFSRQATTAPSALAQRALSRLAGELSIGKRHDDLFLLSHSEFSLTSSREARSYLGTYVASVFEQNLGAKL